MIKILLVYDYSTKIQCKALLSGLKEKNLEVLGQELLQDDNQSSFTPRDLDAEKRGWREQADLVLVVVGEQTYRNKLVEHEINEIRKYREQELPIVAVRTQRNNVQPRYLYGVKALWASEFSVDAIDNTIKEAVQKRAY